MILGIIIGISITIFLICILYFGYKVGLKANETEKVDDEAIKLMQKREEGFRNVMDYDVDVALGRRVSGE